MTDDARHEETLSIEPRADQFAIVRVDGNGNRTELVLSYANLIFLARALSHSLQKITAERSKPGMSATVAVPVNHARVGVDLGTAEILVTLVDQFGNEIGFAFSPDIARPLAQHILDRLPEAFPS